MLYFIYTIFCHYTTINLISLNLQAQFFNYKINKILHHQAPELIRIMVEKLGKTYPKSYLPNTEKRSTFD